MSTFTIGLDFGTNSVRALIVRCADGRELASGSATYSSGHYGVIVDAADPQFARQHPGDYLPALERSVTAALRSARHVRGFSAARVIGIGVDATGSSPLPVDRANRPLAFASKWHRHPAAQCWLWKDHTSWREAAEITAAARRRQPEYLRTCGGVYSSEWLWSKLLRCARTAPEVFAAAHSWVELADWIASTLGGVDDPSRIVRSTCLAGLKAMFSEEWGGLPSARFLSGIDPRLADLRDRLFERAHAAATPAGTLSPAWASRLGLRAGIPIANTGLDCHSGAVGCGVAPGVLGKIVGTSGCHCAVLPKRWAETEIPGVCGLARDAILPGLVGVEAGQPAVGDIFRWWAERICDGGAAAHGQLSAAAARLAPGESGLLALDWHNGNRTLLADPQLTGALVGCSLHTSRAEIYRALLEATAFGSRTIRDHLRANGVPVRRVVCAGGVAVRNPLLMQIYADVLGCRVELAASSNASALGAAIAAAVLGGAARGIPAAQASMVRKPQASFVPDPGRRRTYDALHALYRDLHDSFGRRAHRASLAHVMKELLALQAPARATRHART